MTLAVASTELESNTILITFKCLLYVIRHPKGTLKHLEISQCYNFCHMHYSNNWKMAKGKKSVF